jgi:DNA-binding response OmpR family regulator
MPLPPKKILCADGNEDTCVLVKYLLMPLGYEVKTVNELAGGLRAAQEEHFDLYLISYKLTEGTGVEMCRRLRGVDRQTPIIFWSALVYERDRQLAYSAGASVFLRKPDDFDKIPAMVSRLITQPGSNDLIQSGAQRGKPSTL